jgi:hypothetical protein
MTPLILSSLAKSSCLAGAQGVAAKALSGNGPPPQRSPHNDAVWSMEVKDDN